MAHLMFVLAQNFQNNEESWLANFAYVRVNPFYLYGIACAHCLFINAENVLNLACVSSV